TRSGQPRKGPDRNLRGPRSGSPSAPRITRRTVAVGRRPRAEDLRPAASTHALDLDLVEGFRVPVPRPEGVGFDALGHDRVRFRLRSPRHRLRVTEAIRTAHLTAGLPPGTER